MPRSPRIEFEGAIYHVMARGDRKEDIFFDAGDRDMFFKTLGQSCERSGAFVHAYVLMPNHYHLVLETPEPNLVATMKWLQATYTRRFNTKHKRWGHLFGGRYKAIVVEPNAGSYFPNLVDYVHLNPVRAGLVKEGDGLDTYPWSSLTEFRKPASQRFEWLQSSKVFSTCGLKDSAAGRKALIRRLEKKVSWEHPTKAGNERISGQSMHSSLRRGWYFGSQAFREKLLGLVGKDAATYHNAARSDLARHNAESLLDAGLKAVGLEGHQLSDLRKGDHRKAFIAYQIFTKTTVPRAWIAESLSMGNPATVTRSVRLMRDRAKDNDAQIEGYEQDMMQILAQNDQELPDWLL